MSVETQPHDGGEPSTEDIRATLTDRVLSGEGESVYVGTVKDGHFASFIAVDSDEREDAASMIEGAESAIVIHVHGPEANGGQFVTQEVPERERDERHQNLMRNTLEDADERRDEFEKQESLDGYTARERAVLAAGTFASQKLNPLAALLGGM